jgi:hypothetical protein
MFYAHKHYSAKRIIKSRRIGLARHVARMGEERRGEERRSEVRHAHRIYMV